MKIMSGDFTAKLDKEDIFKPTVWNESLQEVINDNEIRVSKVSKAIP
jgi:hypothetical protein